MAQILNFIEIIVSVLLMICILLQHRASGLSATFGGAGSSSIVQRRGAESVIFRAAVVLSAIFLLIPVLQWFIL
ncbi:preprotein translocase subunit SecG [Patescibacteria group bacterium]|nr:preprotein translocase subunit SecG [Patescibacteria group bacterium]